jgi:hypothetical protein
MAITKILNIMESEGRNPASHLKNALEYIKNPDKTEECVLVGSINCLPDTAFEQMVETKNIFNKTGNRQGYHVIISFSPEEKVTAEQAMYVLEHFAKDVLGDDYEAVFAVHTDREHMHGHLIWNSVSVTTGKKYNSPKGNWKNHLQPITNKYCNELGLGIIPAEYSKNPKNISRDKWEKEMSMKEIILRDAQMCAYAAGDVEHFKYLMRRLGYIFKSGVWMEVQDPGYRYYHSLAKMDEMFSKNKIRYYVDMPWMVHPHFYSKNIRYLKHTNISEFQKKYYAKMYRLRMVEQNRFKVNAVKYAEDLKRFHQLQDEYLMLVDNNIRDFYDLLDYRSEQEKKMKGIDDRQHEIYRLSSGIKRAIKTDEQYRDYQLWHMDMQKELDVLKQQKKDAKKQIGLVDMAIKENLYTAYHDVLEMGELIEDNELVIPQREEMAVHKGHTDEVDVMEVERTEEGVSVTDAAFLEGKQGKDASEDVCVADLEYVGKAGDGETYPDVPEQKYRGNDLKESYENFTEEMYGSKSEPAMDMEEVVTETNVKDKSFYSYADYQVSSDEEKIRMAGVNENDDVLAVYEKLNSFFKQIGHEADFDRLYEEAKRLANVVRKIVVADKTYKIARKLSEYGPYKYLKTSVKADAFKFDVSDAGGNLKLFMSVLDKLGVKLDGDRLYEEYQKIYDETVSRNEMHEMEQEKQWNKGRGR